MLRLNSDILFEIGKKLIEDGDSDAVLRFGLSGKEPWNALIKVFASVKILKLYYFYYSIGWDENCCCTFYFGSNPHSTFLMNCIGASVKNLQLFEQLPIYKQILDKISERQQLNSIFIDPSFFSIFFSVKLLKHHSKTLKHVSIPSQCMTEELQNLLNLESLTCLDFCGTKEFLQNFCKTTFLTLQSKQWKICANELIENPNLLSVKQLILNFTGYGNILKMPLFPSVEHVCYKWNTGGELSDSKVQQALEQIQLSGNEADHSHPDYYRFKNIIPSGDSDSVQYELLLLK